MVYMYLFVNIMLMLLFVYYDRLSLQFVQLYSTSLCAYAGAEIELSIPCSL